MLEDFAETLALLRVEYEDHGVGCNCPVHYLIAGIDRVRADLWKQSNGDCSPTEAVAAITKTLGMGLPPDEG